MTIKTSNMIISKARERDRELRLLALRNMQRSLERGKIDDAQFFGAESSRLKKRIETHDYRHEDAEDAVLDALDRRWKENYHKEAAPKENPIEKIENRKIRNAYEEMWSKAFREWDRVVSSLFEHKE